MSFSFHMYVGKGIDEYIRSLDLMVDRSEEMLTETIKPGAKIIADEVKKEIYSLPVIDREQRSFKKTAKSKSGGKKRVNHKTPSTKRTGITSVEKDGLVESMGLAPIRDDNGFLNTKLGFDGYNKHVTPDYPKGHPNVMIARSLESGTSFMQKVPFVTSAVRRVKDKAEQEMAKQYEKEVKKVMNI